MIVEIIGDSSHLNRTLRNTARETQRFEGRIERTGRGLNRAFAAAGITVGLGTLTAGLMDSVNAASDLNEQISKTNVVFGRSANEILDWSQTTASAMGISERQALATASSFGALFAPLGLLGQESAEQSKRLTQLGADLASFYNTDVQDALDAIRSGIVGESEPLRRYGVLLSETRVQAQALADTHKKSAQDLTAAEKALARITLIMQDTSQAQGDFARTSDNLANETRKLRAEWDELKTSIGERAVPAMTTLTSAANASIPALDKFGDVIGFAADKMKKLPANRAVIETFQFLTRPPDKGWKEILEGLNTFLASVIPGRRGLDAQDRFDLTRNDLVPDLIKGRGFGGTITTAAQLRAIALARTGGTGTDAEIAALRAEQAADEKALAVALRMMQTQGKNQKRFADEAERLTGEIAASEQRIAAIAAGRQQAAETARDAAAEAAKLRMETKFGWLEFAVERAETTKTIKDDVKAYRAIEAAIKERIQQEGRTLELVRYLWRTREKIRNLNKQESDKDPLSGLMGGMSSRQIAQLLAAGTGLGAAGVRTLAGNVARADIVLYNQVNLDGRQVAHSTNRQNARTAHRTSRQTSGLRE